MGKAIADALTKSPELADTDPSFAHNAPSWCYVLTDARHEWLGRRTVAEHDPNWQPAVAGQPVRTLGSLLKSTSG